MASGKIDTLDELVIALCLDYRRRQNAIEEKNISKRIDTEYRYYNFKIYDASAEIVGERLAEGYIEEIGRRVGYAKSALCCFSEVMYKNYKRKIIDNIAKKLHLA